MKENIALIVHELRGAGTERAASNISLHLGEEYRVHLIVYDGENIGYPYKGVLLPLGSKASGTFPGKIAALIKRIYMVGKLKRKYRIQASISFLEGPNIVNILTKGKGRTIISVRNYLSKSEKGFYGCIYRLLIPLLYNRADCIVAVSKAVKNDLVTNFKLEERKTKVIYNPCDIKGIRLLSAEEPEEKWGGILGETAVISVGRLCEQKGQWHLIRAFGRAKSELPRLKLVIIGEGDLKGYLKELAEQYGLQEDIYFCGFCENPFKYVSRSGVFVLSSLYEGFPNVLVEAMACGIPIISSDCRSGPREIIAPASDYRREAEKVEYEEFGILTPVCDGRRRTVPDGLTREEELLAEAIVELYRRDGLMEHYRLKSRERAQYFEANKIVTEYIRVLEEAKG